MSLQSGCPRCPAAVSRSGPGTGPGTGPGLGTGAGWVCDEHGSIEPLWRPEVASYDTFADHLRASRGFPTLLPWPMSPGWSVTDFAVVGDDPQRARATMTCCSGSSDLDGPVDVLIVTEEIGTGLGGRCAGTGRDDPDPEMGAGASVVRVRVDGQLVKLWPVSVSSSSGDWDRSVVAGEAAGRWLWMVLRPASAMLLLRDDWILRDVSGLGPHLVELPFGGPAPRW